MGSRSKTHTVVDLLGAFFRDRTWSQAALAREFELDVKTVRRVLNEMLTSGLPLEREEDHPHVYWTMDPKWLPDAVSMGPEDVRRLLRSLLRLPTSAEREALIRNLLSATDPAYAELFAHAPQVHEAVDPGVTPELLEVIEDATLARRPLVVRYYTASRGEIGNRVLSPARIADRHRQLLAHCHLRNEPRWFRLDRIQSARLDDDTTYVEVAAEEVERMVAESVGGFAAPGEPVSVRFRVLPPAKRWFDVPSGLASEDRGDVLLCHGETRGLTQLAVRLMELGAQVAYDSDELRDEVRRLIGLAQSALAGD